MTEQQLLDLKKKVDKAKTIVSELEGEQKALMKQLKEEWQCTSVEEGIIKGKKMAKEIEQLDSEIDQLTNKLEEKYNPNED